MEGCERRKMASLMLQAALLCGLVTHGMSTSHSERADRVRRKTILFETYSHRQWPTVIPYRLHDSLTEAEKASIVAVLREDFEVHTCLRFTDHVIDSQQFILFRHSDGREGECKAYIGMEHDVRTTHFQGQPIYLDAHCMVWRGSLLYLIASTLGMYGEARRPDRDEYVDVYPENMEPWGFHWFEKKDGMAIDTHGVPYDYGSLMHPGPRVWLKPELQNDTEAYVVLPKDLAYLRTMGQQSELSFYDVMALNSAYCAHACETQSGHVVPQCANGGYQDPNDCSKCKCPDGYGGDVCDDVTSGSAECSPSSGHLQATEVTTCVTSPGYVQNMPYVTGDTCAWRVHVPTDRQLRLWFDDYFALPHLDRMSTEACLHWVEVQQRGVYDHRGPRYCGYVEEHSHPTTQQPLMAQSDQLLIIFKSPNASIDAHLNFPNASRVGFKLCFNTTETPRGVLPERPVSQKSTEGVVSATFVLIVAAGAVFVVFLLAIVLYCLCRRRKHMQEPNIRNVVVTHRNGEVSVSPVYTISDQSRGSGATFNNAVYEHMHVPDTDMHVACMTKHVPDADPPRYEEHVPPLHKTVPEHDFPHVHTGSAEQGVLTDEEIVKSGSESEK